MIELEVLFHTDGTSALKELDIDYDLEDCEIRMVSFIHVNAFCPYIEKGKQYTSIFTNGNEYICPWPYNHIKNILQNAL